jgi:hypothetical protein
VAVIGVKALRGVIKSNLPNTEATLEQQHRELIERYNQLNDNHNKLLKKVNDLIKENNQLTNDIKFLELHLDEKYQPKRSNSAPGRLRS